MRTTVSAVIPCYNAAAFIGAAITSVRTQTRPVDEILVVDDASTDGSAEIAETLGARVLRLPSNLGSAAARNRGLSEARGEFVALLDADDYWAPEHCETVAGLLERHPTAVLSFSLARSFGLNDDEWPALMPADQLVHALWIALRRCMLPQNAVVLRRAWVLDAGGYDERYRLAEDFDLWLRLAHLHPFVCTHAVTAYWRRHEQQSSRNMMRYWRGEYESRARFLTRCQTENQPELAGDVARALRDVWEEHLESAWTNRRRDQFAFHLSMATHVPGAEVARVRWTRRGRMIVMARLWDALPRAVQAGVRRAVR